MEELEDFIKNNKETFDRVTPKRKEWKISERKKGGIVEWKFLLRIAAVFVLVSAIILLKNFPQDNQFDDVAMHSPEGKLITLDPSLNKYTLVQFWESGNVVCSDDNCYYYLPAYEKYREKGFEIYAISLDEDQDSWIQGIEENKLPWIHVSDLKGWESPICIECDISKVPTSFLIDHKGRIIEKDLDAAKLESTLERLLAAK